VERNQHIRAYGNIVQRAGHEDHMARAGRHVAS
jgi:hypothetical protein